jgi:hypothetical protein
MYFFDLLLEDPRNFSEEVARFGNGAVHVAAKTKL